MDGTAAAALLGVTESADLIAVRAAFRSRAKQTHPDLGGDPFEFQATLQAFNLLCTRVGTPTAQVPASTLPPLVAVHPGFCQYDSTPNPDPGRSAPKFADVLRVALAREASAARR